MTDLLAALGAASVTLVAVGVIPRLAGQFVRLFRRRKGTEQGPEQLSKVPVEARDLSILAFIAAARESGWQVSEGTKAARWTRHPSDLDVVALDQLVSRISPENPREWNSALAEAVIVELQLLDEKKDSIPEQVRYYRLRLEEAMTRTGLTPQTREG